MASAPLHFAIGTATGMVLLAPRILAAWNAREKLATATRTWLLISWGCGIVAAIPSLLRYAGFPESIYANPWMNIFFLHPWINRILPRNELPGSLAMAICWTTQYAWVLAAVLRSCRIRK